LFENGVIELTFECIPRSDTWQHGYLHFFWASYIDRPESLDIHFLGRPENEPAAPIAWVRGFTCDPSWRQTSMTTWIVHLAQVRVEGCGVAIGVAVEIVPLFIQRHSL
jgi:hypothetical protein